ncbi:MAG: hypothetical protein K8T20_09965 [Planctomycetes bacterium]|nr:hypothetical protein [Planctomycetota bacterium]
MPTTVRKSSLGPALLLMLVALAAGCRKKSSHTTVLAGDDDIFTTDDFPGAPVQNGNVADDGRAMSPAGENYSQLGCVFNGDRGTAIALFFTEASDPTKPEHLYATHYDGETWTPPVSLAAADGQPIEFKFAMNAVVAFLNTANHPDPEARERDGDAVIGWIGRDLDQDGAATADDVNSGIYTSYFNVSERDNAALNHGFQLLADRISTEDEDGENVGGVGIISDGVCGEARSVVGTFQYRYGDDTTGLALVWSQQENNDSLTPGAEDTSLRAVIFNLGQDGDTEAPLTPGSDTRVPILGFGASDSGLGSEETLVSSTFHTYNNFLIMRVASNDQVGSDVIMNNNPPLSLSGPMLGFGNPMAKDGDDITLQVVRFDLLGGTMSPPSSLGNTPDSTDAFESNDEFIFSFPHAIYGDDEGLAQLLVFHVVLLADADALTDFGSMFADGELFATGVDLTTGAATSSVILDEEDPAIFDTVLPSSVDTRISRNGDFIWVAWTEADSDGAFDDQALRVAQFATTRLNEDGSIPAAIPQVSSRCSPTTTLSTDIDGFDVDWFMFQGGLGYVCGAQSDPDVMNLFFEHSDGTEDVIHHARLTADFGAPVTPAFTVGVLETFEDTEMSYSGVVQPSDGKSFVATDAGEGGEALCAYRRDADPTAGIDFRAFARRTGSGSGAVEIDSALTTRQVVPASLRLLGTPAGSEIGVFDPVTGEDSEARPHGWTRVHVLFFESNTSENSGQGYALRTRVFLADGDSATPFGDRFSPSAGTAFAAPTEISLPFGDPDIAFDAEILGLGTGGDAAGVWFTEQGHVYYQEYDDSRRGDGSSGWIEADGVSDPALADDDSPIELESPFPTVAVLAPACGCDTLHHAMVFWVKELDAGSGHGRLQVRVRE